MTSQRIAFGLLAGVPLVAACAPNFRPLGEQEVFIDAYAENATYTEDGETYGAEFQACIRDPALGPECGFRKNDAEEYDWDSFIFEADGEEAAIICYRWNVSNAMIQMGTCKAPFKSLSVGQEVSVSINEFSGSTLSIPTAPRLTLPVEGGNASLTADGGLKLSWEGTGASSETLTWYVRPNGPMIGVCADDVTWDYATLDGLLDDTGSVLIPKEMFPPDLPAEGCPVVVNLDRARPGHLDPGIRNGEIFGHQLFTINATLKP